MAAPPPTPPGTPPLPGTVAVPLPSLADSIKEWNTKFLKQQQQDSQQTEKARIFRLLDAQGFVINLCNLDARLITAAVTPGASKLASIDDGLLAQLRSQHENMHRLYVEEERKDFQADGVIQYYAGLGWAAGCHILDQHTGASLNLSVARQLQTLREGNYDAAIPRGATSVQIDMLDLDNKLLMSHTVENLDKLMDVLENGA